MLKLDEGTWAQTGPLVNAEDDAEEAHSVFDGHSQMLSSDAGSVSNEVGCSLFGPPVQQAWHHVGPVSAGVVWGNAERSVVPALSL